MTPHINSPIPKTRIEKIDSSPSHGEIPGTEAYKMREADAQPDEIAVENDDTEEYSKVSMETPRQEVPITVLEPVQSDRGGSPAPTSSPDVDAKPDVVLEPTNNDEEFTTSDAEEDAAGEEQDDEFGDDFDDFEEGAHDEDFDDFEDRFQQPQTSPAASQSPPQVQLSRMPFVRNPGFEHPGIFVPSNKASSRYPISMAWALTRSCQQQSNAWTACSHPKKSILQPLKIYQKKHPCS